jgi:hypothetical protein
MNWSPKIDWVEVEPFLRDRIKKKKWDNELQTWVEYTNWRIPFNSDTLIWLQENYAGGGWSTTFDKLVVTEEIYVMYCLKFGK